MNTTCTHHLHDGPLACVRTDPHDVGHVYESSRGSDVPDRHDATSGGEH